MTAPFEAGFRAKFEPRGDGLLYRTPAGGVIYSRAEVDAFVRDRRRAWANPWAWGLFVLGGTAGLWLWFSGMAYGGEYGTILTVVTTVPIVMTLFLAEAQPRNVAATRPIAVPVEEAPPRPSWVYLLIGLMLCIAQTRLAFYKPDGIFEWVWLGAALAMGITLILRLWQAWRGVRA